MGTSDDKARLLRSLAIDRGESAEPHTATRRGRLPLLTAAGAAMLLAAGTTLALQWRGGLIGSPPDRTAAEPRQQPPPSPSSPPAQAAAFEPRPSGGLVASGYVVARRKAVVAAEITGKVVEVLVEEGNIVKEGQVVARLDSILAEHDLALAKSRIESAEAAIGSIAADLDDAQRIVTRARTLSQKNITSEADLTKAEARVGVLSAQLRQYRAQHETARLDAQRNATVLDKHQIRAPFDGIVVDKSAQPGEMISPMSVGGFTRTGICTVVDMDSIEIEVDVNEAFIGRVNAGGAVNAVLDAYPGWTIPAYVIAIVPTANREKATVRVRIGFRQKDARILPDMAVKVTFLDETTMEGGRSSKAAAAN
jgi:RND family efflux transporter MFP subunit